MDDSKANGDDGLCYRRWVTGLMIWQCTRAARHDGRCSDGTGLESPEPKPVTQEQIEETTRLRNAALEEAAQIADQFAVKFSLTAHQAAAMEIAKAIRSRKR